MTGIFNLRGAGAEPGERWGGGRKRESLSNLWAMVMTVQSTNSFLMVACTRSSVSRSTAAVASSSTRTCPTAEFTKPLISLLGVCYA